MERIIKIWILSLITVGLIYLAFTNRYTILPGSDIKYDRWTNETSELTQPVIEDNPLYEKFGSRRELEKLLTLKGLIDKLDATSLQQVDRKPPDWLDAIASRRMADSTKYRGEPGSDWLKDYVLDKNIDSLFKQAIYLTSQREKSMIIQRLSELITVMQKELKSSSNR